MFSKSRARIWDTDFAFRFVRVLSEGWLLEDPDWKYDVQPELLDGKNVADFIDPDIMEKLEALEREEEKLEAEGFYQSDDEEIVSFPASSGLLCENS